MTQSRKKENSHQNILFIFRSVVDVFIRYPATSVVDVDAIKQKLVSTPFSNARSDRIGRYDDVIATPSDADYLLYVLAILLAFLLVVAIILLICCCCPGILRILLFRCIIPLFSRLLLLQRHS